MQSDIINRDVSKQQSNKLYIKNFGYDDEQPIYSANIVELTTKGIDLYNSIKPGVFKNKFFELCGLLLQRFFIAISKALYNNEITDTSSINYQTSNDVFFLQHPLKFRINGAEKIFRNANLVIIMTVLIAQLRQRLWRLQNARLKSQFSFDLIEALENILMLIPEKQEKIILVKDKNNNNQMKEIPILYEPFIDQIANAFTEAKKAQSKELVKKNENVEIKSEKSIKSKYHQNDWKKKKNK